MRRTVGDQGTLLWNEQTISETANMSRSGRREGGWGRRMGRRWAGVMEGEEKEVIFFFLLREFF